MTTLNVASDEIPQRREEAILSGERKKLILGREVTNEIHGTNVGRLLFYEPSPYPTNYEASLVFGPPGSGKTYVGYGLAAQSYFAENRTWIIFDTKLSYIGNWRPNVSFLNEISDCGLMPMGIPSKNMTIAAPSFYINAASPKELDVTKVTDVYKIPLRLCRPGILFELAKMNTSASYKATFDMKFKELLWKTNKRPTKKQLFDTIKTEVIESDDYPNNIKWAYKLLMQKIREVEHFTIDDTCYWSVIGDALNRAAQTGKPGWIVFTLAHAQNPQDDANLALVTAVLEEIKDFAQEARMNGYKIKLGIIIDELHTYVRQRDASSTEAIHDLIFAWGRTSKLWRIFMTQKKEQLPKAFQDDMKNLEMSGTYQNLIQCQSVPESGYGKMLDRLNSATKKSRDEPRFLPSVKFLPPIIEVESSMSDDNEWRAKMFGGGSPKKSRSVSTKSMQEAMLGMIGASNIQRTFANSAVGSQSTGATADEVTPVLNDAGNIPEVEAMWKGIRSKLDGENVAAPHSNVKIKRR